MGLVIFGLVDILVVVAAVTVAAVAAAECSFEDRETVAVETELQFAADRLVDSACMHSLNCLGQAVAGICQSAIVRHCLVI